MCNIKLLANLPSSCDSWCAGFGAAFWSGYHELIPREPGFDERADLYTLYHKLNHYNLFGSGYLGDCEWLLGRLVRHVK